MVNPSEGLRIQTVFAIAMAAVFLILAMGIALTGAGVYRRITESSEQNYTHRTALSYIINHVRRSDSLGLISIGAFGDSDAVFLKSIENGTEYTTNLYMYNGQLCELYFEADLGLSPADGTPILPLSALDISEEDGIISVSVTEEGGQIFSGSVFPRCGVEVLK